MGGCFEMDSQIFSANTIIFNAKVLRNTNFMCHIKLKDGFRNDSFKNEQNAMFF